MEWVITGRAGGEPRPFLDGRGWLWELRRGDDVRRVLVEISGIAREAHERGGYVPADTAEAIATAGQSEVRKLVARSDLPRIIRCGTLGCHRT